MPDIWKINQDNPEAINLLESELKIISKRVRRLKKHSDALLKSTPTYKLYTYLINKNINLSKKYQNRLHRINNGNQAIIPPSTPYT